MADVPASEPTLHDFIVSLEDPCEVVKRLNREKIRRMRIRTAARIMKIILVVGLAAGACGGLGIGAYKGCGYACDSVFGKHNSWER